ncbi:unknown similar to AMEV075 [Adoxophyes honmai entomopoxvirus 'L']|uniref:Uncharacterized protein n=1 Tax=Adoxophyes honmai entomopoxvirus 'L' TaxID=1293540 RepID=A0A916NWL7_9POXV|nr:unknown similar to AMEV075 [Adoxophyes honmai entomopoxvirus 'L']CCU55333.1 unknown similar to AMEV075 [Adoxophyes honmai entomopoxvirus 'L']
MSDKKNIIDDLVDKNLITNTSLIDNKKIIKFLIDSDQLYIDDIECANLSDLSISIDILYEIFESVLEQSLIRNIIFEGLLNLVADQEMKLEDELLVYIGYCNICDPDAEIFTINMEDFEKSLDYADAIILNSKHIDCNYEYSITDLFCDKCGRALFDIDPYEIY